MTHREGFREVVETAKKIKTAGTYHERESIMRLIDFVIECGERMPKGPISKDYLASLCERGLLATVEAISAEPRLHRDQVLSIIDDLEAERSKAWAIMRARLKATL